MQLSKRNIIIIGGGITGLSSAFYVRKYFREQGLHPHITVVEQSGSLGGKVHTLHRDGFVIEKGPDSYLARKTAMTELAEEVGLGDELTTTNPNAKKTYILHDGKLHPMPSGLVLGIPTELRPFMESDLISMDGKIRALEDFLLPAKMDGEDESLGDFIERRLGKEVLENVTEPLLAGIYAGDTRKLSLQATFPQFGAVEREYGSLIKGMSTGRKPVETHTGTKKSAFFTFKRGLQSLTEKLQETLSPDVDFRLHTGANSIVYNNSMYTVALSDGTTLEAEHVIVTVPAFAAAPLLKGHADTTALERINYVSVANVVMAFDRKHIETEYDGSGFLVPRKEGRTITACTWTSTKWLHTSPDDRVLMRFYVGRDGQEEIVEQTDEQITACVLKDMRELMGIDAQPLFTEITRLRRSMPQYPVGHIDSIQNMRSELEQQRPGLLLLGAGYDGVGLPDCIRTARDAAELESKRVKVLAN
ncbi:protoporphyrinogen oxidase [Paenibacillus wenxiniae]|uniref:Coproporphyrinogen III oxidase n=1 Tax=Paenibacillus wenxiniae TaxID=1636843 RepID=A0ABW4RJ65_9BACL